MKRFSLEGMRQVFSWLLLFGFHKGWVCLLSFAYLDIWTVLFQSHCIIQPVVCHPLVMVRSRDINIDTITCAYANPLPRTPPEDKPPKNLNQNAIPFSNPTPIIPTFLTNLLFFFLFSPPKPLNMTPHALRPSPSMHGPLIAEPNDSSAHIASQSGGAANDDGGLAEGALEHAAGDGLRMRAAGEEGDGGVEMRLYQ